MTECDCECHKHGAYPEDCCMECGLDAAIARMESKNDLD